MPVTTRPKLASIAPYKQIESDLTRRIERGEWAPGMMIPSRRALAEEYNVELPTVQRAVAGLLRSAMLRADGGRGTFVAARQPSESLAERLPDSTSAANDSLLPSRRIASPVAQATFGIVSSSKFLHIDGTVEDNPWNATVVRSIERYVTSNGASSRNIDVSERPNDPNAPLEAARQLVDQGVNGIVLVLARGHDIYLRAIPELRKLGVPIVYVGGSEIRLPVMQIYFDDRDGGQTAATHLIERGASRLAFIAPFTEYWVTARLEGMREAMTFRGLGDSVLDARVDSQSSVEALDLIRRDASMERVAYEFGQRQIASGFDPEGIVAANDLIAYGYIKAAKEAGREMGRDYMIVGFDDDARSRPMGLTTMHPPLESMGEEAARLVNEMCGSVLNSRRICLQSHLIARDSTSLQRG
ncbi:MAG TPA: GntR family transcriptional regulator [Capsulimonadaceae bacterium]|jgi:DNA-binding LacI/PurR family transcriptional regulator/DNA-binding transcriptional regulator YhcF (GntR family)